MNKLTKTVSIIFFFFFLELESNKEVTTARRTLSEEKEYVNFSEQALWHLNLHCYQSPFSNSSVTSKMTAHIPAAGAEGGPLKD